MTSRSEHANLRADRESERNDRHKPAWGLYPRHLFLWRLLASFSYQCTLIKLDIEPGEVVRVLVKSLLDALRAEPSRSSAG